MTSSKNGPWRTAGRQLIRNRPAMIAAAAFVIIVLACLAAPLYAHHVAHVDPFTSNISGTTEVDGRTTDLLQQSTDGLGLGVTPLGPTWDLRHYFLGADNQGRDVMSRLLYGGRNSLAIGLASAAVCCLLAAVLGIAAGYFGGWADAVLSRLFDVVWALPVYLLAICLSVVLMTGGLDIGPLHLDAGSMSMPVLIIAVIYVPYVARPLRGQVMALREREFVHASIGTGAGDWRIMRREVLPNVLPTLIVFLPMMTALNMLTESALSFLSVGVQSPDASWGTIINDGLGLLYTRPAVTVAPGLLIAATAVALNILGDGVRDALDPNARVRGSV
ncbi:ABC transporter permease subunit [Streptomyces sp. NPDC008150]|uniref:ABC transporter permease n=1 Tax=Streptomyces sp. NPDC008150 TaxID=3364816 RepID=UPI0036E413E2